MTTGAQPSPPAPASTPGPATESAAESAAGPAPASGGEPGRSGPPLRPASRPVSPAARDLWRTWRVPLAIVAVILLGGTVIALLQPGVVVTGYLDPAGTGTTGAHAITDILSDRGDTVIRAITPAAAEAAARSPVTAGASPAGASPRGASPGGVTLVVTTPSLLTAAQLDGLARVPADRVLIGPDLAALNALAPRVELLGTAPVQALSPGCDLTAARLAGNADLGGAQLAVRPAPRPKPRRSRRGAAGQAALCYPTGGSASLVRYTAAGRVITVVGSGNALTNGSLAHLGNAALALNLLGTHTRIVWLVPGPGLPGGVSGSGAPANGQQSLLSLIPLPAYLVTIQLGIAVLLAAAWRARRLGPLVPEPLPVVVRASETAEGHAGLYRSRRARGRAAAALRTAMLARTLPALGLAPHTGPAEVAAAFSARSGSGQAQIEAMLFGPVPGDDAALVALAHDLDALEREVRTQ
jgi:hypothetical protein